MAWVQARLADRMNTGSADTWVAVMGDLETATMPATARRMASTSVPPTMSGADPGQRRRPIGTLGSMSVGAPPGPAGPPSVLAVATGTGTRRVTRPWAALLTLAGNMAGWAGPSRRGPPARWPERAGAVITAAVPAIHGGTRRDGTSQYAPLQWRIRDRSAGSLYQPGARGGTLIGPSTPSPP
jgi:hypothetical protein